MATISLEQATAVKERHEQDWIKRPGVTGVDVGYREEGGTPTKDVVIRVYVSGPDKAAGFPGQVDGVPVQVIQRRFELH